MSGFLSAGAQLIEMLWMLTKIVFAGFALVLALYIVYVVVNAVPWFNRESNSGAGEETSCCGS